MKRIRDAVLPHCSLLGLLSLVGAGQTAMAQGYEYFDAGVVSSGPTNCSMQSDASYYHFQFSLRFNPSAGHIVGGTFLSRGIAVHRYDANGKPLNWHTGMRVFLSGEQALGVASRSNSAVMFGNINEGNGIWHYSWAFSSNVRITIDRAYIDAWPAVGVQIANVLTPFDSPSFVLASKDVYYFYRDMPTGDCRLIDPVKPPPSPVTTEIKVTAPDWDLGELERGKETTRTFTTDAQRLCFSYDPKYIEYDKYLISASNRNGVAGNKFQLAAKADPGQRVPYTLSLTGGGAPVALPSANGLSLTLGKSGRTCLTPTFKAWAGADLKSGGDFSDVLTFTIVTTP